MKLKKDTVSDEIPTSSMADIAFLLIIYFMVTTTFAATRGLDFALPKDDDSPPQVEKEESVLIEIQPAVPCWSTPSRCPSTRSSTTSSRSSRTTR